MKRLLTNPNAIIPSDSDPSNDPICGFIDRQPASSNVHFQTRRNIRWSFNCDFLGGDIGDQHSSMEQCSKLCDERECVFSPRFSKRSK